MDISIAATIGFTAIPTLVLVGLWLAMRRGNRRKPS
jgi:hypothetical protein